MCKKVLIAMSGGVDSSVAAFLMKEKGYDCVGATMKLFQTKDICINDAHSCCTEDDIADAKAIADRLNMPHHVLNYTGRFKEFVVDKFVKCYENGLTPNPCVDCNRYMKFEKLFAEAANLGCDYIVTGHYARIEYDEKYKRNVLKKAIDPSKDQSYVLYSLNNDQLNHTIFPLGSMPKADTRSIADNNNFVNAKKHDSQDICFIPNGKYAEFIENYTGNSYLEGNFVDTEGNILGKHKGIIRYTVGQRKGLGLALKEPMYVKKVDPIKNEVILARDCDLYSTTLRANNLNLTAIDSIDSPIKVLAKVRYKHTEQPATVTQIDKDTIEVVFDEPQRAITKGQAVVLYDGDIVIGGGTIFETNLV